MRGKIIFFLSIICFSGTLLGQDTTKLRKYFEIVHEATESVVRNDYPNAVALYKTAFPLLESPFSLDVNNMVYALTESRYPDTTEITTCLKILQRKGRCVHEYYSKFPKIIFYCNLLDHKECSLTANEKMTTLMDQLADKDRAVRRLHPDIYDASVIDEVRSVDSANYYTLVKIFRYLLKNNLRAEDEIGTRGANTIDLLLQHSTPWGFYNKQLTDSLITMGCLDGRYLAPIYDQNCKFYQYRNASRPSDWRTDAGCIDGSIYGSVATRFSTDQKAISVLFIPGESKRQQMNRKRRELYLGDIVDCRKFTVYAMMEKTAFSFPLESSVWIPDEQGMYEFIVDMANLENGTFKRYGKKEDFSFD